ncbi:MAG: hypothetical protein JXR94_12230, partial [Candidatus Hydrogenedentes bacterium]|nr:hypothetical protein [Candidatus Hydrogenedentota bacterium]
QLWAVEAVAPYRRTELSRVPGGVTPTCAVSRDGRWGVGVSQDAEGPILHFVDLRSVSFRAARIARRESGP